MSRFSHEAKRVLEAAGWSPGRWVDVARQLAQIEEDQGPVLPFTEAFLREFSGLTYRRGEFSEFYIDAFKALEREADITWDDRGRIGSPVNVVGQAESGYMSVLLDEKGQIWLAMDEQLTFMGATPDEAMERMCADKKADNP